MSDYDHPALDLRGMDLQTGTSHCRHATCCQCGAERGTIKHSQECADAAIRRAMNKAMANAPSRLLVPWPRALGTSLSIAGALCEAHDLALNEAEDHHLYHKHGYRLDGCWKPGCGKNAHV